MNTSIKRPRIEEQLIKVEDWINAFKEWLGPLGKMIWDTITLLVGLIGTVLIAYAVYPNPEHLMFSIGQDHSLLYGNSPDLNSSAYAIVDEQKFSLGVSIIFLAFILQMIGIWGLRIRKILWKLYVSHLSNGK